MRTRNIVERVNEAIDHLSERLSFKDIMAPAFASEYGGAGVTISVPVFDGCAYFEIHSEEVKKNGKTGLTRLVRHRLLIVLSEIRDSIYKADSTAEPGIFSGMSFKEIQTAADTMLNSDEHASTDDLIILIANLAARMKEKE